MGDQDMQTITVNVTRRDEQINLTGYTVTFEGVTGGNTKIYDTTGINGSSLATGTFQYTFPNKAFSAAGKYHRAYFSFVKSGQRDTTGEFTVIVADNSDIDASEAETIITEYNKLVEKLNKTYEEAVKRLDDDYEVIAGRVKEIEAELEALKKLIADYQTSVDQTAADAKVEISDTLKRALDAIDEALAKLSSADIVNKTDLLNFISGENIETKFTSNLVDKVNGSLVENPNIVYANTSVDLLSPDKFNYEISTPGYQLVNNLDDLHYISQIKEVNRIRQICVAFNVVEDIERKTPWVFTQHNATTLDQKIELVRKLVDGTIHPIVYASGSGAHSTNPGATRAQVNMQIWGTTWHGGAVNTTNKISLLEYKNQTGQRIQNDGCVYIIVYAPVSDGVVASTVNLDYAALEYTISTSLSDSYTAKQDFIKHLDDKENPHGVTAAQTGAVALTGNQTVNGTKDFQTAPTVKGDTLERVQGVKSYNFTDKIDKTYWTSGTVWIGRAGDVVTISFQAAWKVKSWGAALLWELPKEFQSDMATLSFTGSHQSTGKGVVFRITDSGTNLYIMGSDIAEGVFLTVSYPAKYKLYEI
ncbi:hypothetical protein RV18_GL001957 [Enterococcus termitis]|nr:hypothetical protein RV18_GL001957 [Enterococcus termitis]